MDLQIVQNVAVTGGWQAFVALTLIKFRNQLRNTEIEKLHPTQRYVTLSIE